MNYGQGFISEELSAVLICKRMSWGYETYAIQPQWFLDILGIVDTLDALYQEKMTRQAKRKRNG